jgi:VWFA-related protein
MVAIVSTSGSLGSLQQFTNDKQRLLSALNRFALQIPLFEKVRSPRYNMTPDEAVRIDSGDQQVLNAVKIRVRSEELAAPDNTLGSERQRGQTNNQPEGQNDALENSVRAQAKAMVSELNQATRNNLRTLESIFRGMAELPGRKIVLYLSESLLSLGGTSEDLSNQILQLIETARRSGVSVYALDAASERVTSSGTLIRLATPGMAMSDYEKMGGARLVVAGTGGELIANTNDLEAGIDRAVEDSRSYYVIGFKPKALDNKFHRLTVTIKGRTDLLVRTRRGYFAVNQETATGTNTELAAALISPVPRIDVPLEVVANVVPKGNEQIVLTGLHVGRNYLTLPVTSAPDQTVAYEMLAWVFAAGRDQPVGVIKHTSTFDFVKDPQAREKLKTEGFVYVPQPLTLPPGIYQIRAVIREKTTGAVGSAYQFFEVPNVTDKKIVSLSSLILTAPGSDGFSGVYSFKRGAELDVRYVIYNLPGQTAGLSQKVRLLDANGRALMDSELPLAPATAQTAAQGTRITLPTARGRYALIVSLRDAKGKIDIERRVDFGVE